MKTCPVCRTSYSDDSLRFCMKDGTSLVDVPVTSGGSLPEQNQAAAPDSPNFLGESTPPEHGRMVVPLEEEPKTQVRPPVAPPFQRQTAKVVAPTGQRKSNTAVVALLSVLGTLVAIGAVLGGWYALSGRNGNNTASSNVNSQTNANLTTNDNTLSGLNTNLSDNANVNINANANINLNANLPTPTPTRTPTPKPSPTMTPTPANRNTNQANVANANIAVSPTPATSPGTRPTPQPTVSPSPKPPGTVSSGVVNGRAVSLPRPAYPPAAKAMRAGGQVQVQVTIDEDGNVISASAVSGHPLLRQAAAAAARQAKFQPTLLSGEPVRVTGTIVYNFNPQ